MPNLVCTGATLQCSLGTTPARSAPRGTPMPPGLVTDVARRRLRKQQQNHRIYEISLDFHDSGSAAEMTRREEALHRQAGTGRRAAAWRRTGKPGRHEGLRDG